MIKTSIKSFNPQSLSSGKYNFQLVFVDHQHEHEYIPVNVLKGHKEGPVLLILAAVHGDEYEGVQTVLQLFRKLNVKDICGTLLLVPTANVSSYYNESRHSAIDGGNLARAFPGQVDGNYTEKLAWNINHGLLKHSDFLLDLHSGGTNYAMPAMVGYNHKLENEIKSESWKAAESFGMSVIWGHESIPSGRTLSAAAERNIPWLYTEGFGGKRVNRSEQDMFEQGALRLMNHLNMLCLPEEWISGELNPITHRLIGDGNLDEAITAQYDGFFIPTVSLLDEVEIGSIIGRIVSLTGEELQLIKANAIGLVVMLKAVPLTRKGDGLYTLASRQA